MWKLMPSILLLLLAPLTLFANDSKSVRIQEINRNPAQWMNKHVTVQGQVVRQSPDTIVLDGAGIFNDRILVIDGSKMNKNDKSSAAAERVAPVEAMKMNSDLRVTGTLRKLTLSEVKDRYYSHPDEEVISEFSTSMPVLVANFNDLSMSEPAGKKKGHP
jgi:hypothetical protein